MWRRAAAGYLMVLEPACRAWRLDDALPRIAAFGFPALVLALGHVIVAAAAILAGRAVLRNDGTVATFGRLWAAGALVVAIASWLTPYFPVTRPPSERRLVLGIAIGWFLAWYLVLPRFDRAESPGPENAPDVEPQSRARR
jgi:hypothetical protein